MQSFINQYHTYFRANPAEEQATGLYDVGCDDFNKIKPILIFYQKPYPTVHFVLSGKGCYQLGDKTYEISAGDMFYTPENTALRYFPDENDPWTYVWFALQGENLSKFIPLFQLSSHTPVKSMQKFEEVCSVLHKMLENCNTNSQQKIFHCLSAFMEIIALEGKSIESHTDQKTVYVQTVKNLIHENFASPDFTVDALCDMMHLSHSYICRIFSMSEDCTVANYMEKVRLQHAAELLTSTNHSVSKVASLAGYNDPLHFMKRFKMRYGITALSYRRNKFFEENK